MLVNIQWQFLLAAASEYLDMLKLDVIGKKLFVYLKNNYVLIKTGKVLNYLMKTNFWQNHVIVLFFLEFWLVLSIINWVACSSYRSSHPDVFIRKVVLKICCKFTGEHPCRSVISIKLPFNVIEIPPRHGCSPVNLLHISRTPFLKNTSGWLLL